MASDPVTKSPLWGKGDSIGGFYSSRLAHHPIHATLSFPPAPWLTRFARIRHRPHLGADHLPAPLPISVEISHTLAPTPGHTSEPSLAQMKQSIATNVNPVGPALADSGILLVAISPHSAGFPNYCRQYVSSICVVNSSVTILCP